MVVGTHALEIRGKEGWDVAKMARDAWMKVRTSQVPTHVFWVRYLLLREVLGYMRMRTPHVFFNFVGGTCWLGIFFLFPPINNHAWQWWNVGLWSGEREE